MADDLATASTLLVGDPLLCEDPAGSPLNRKQASLQPSLHTTSSSSMDRNEDVPNQLPNTDSASTLSSPFRSSLHPRLSCPSLPHLKQKCWSRSYLTVTHAGPLSFLGTQKPGIKGSFNWIRDLTLIKYGKEYEFNAPIKLLDKHLHAMAEFIDEQIVVVSQVLVADINIGYEDIINTQVLAFNGKPVKNLKSLVFMVESCDDEYMKFDLEYQQIVVLKTSTAKAAISNILSTHGIPSAMSDDLKA